MENDAQRGKWPQFLDCPVPIYLLLSVEEGAGTWEEKELHFFQLARLTMRSLPGLASGRSSRSRLQSALPWGGL